MLNYIMRKTVGIMLKHKLFMLTLIRNYCTLHHIGVICNRVNSYTKSVSYIFYNLEIHQKVNHPNNGDSH